VHGDAPGVRLLHARLLAELVCCGSREVLDQVIPGFRQCRDVPLPREISIDSYKSLKWTFLSEYYELEAQIET
jgi:hypothetical protein